jgi:hypothetical protein
LLTGIRQPIPPDHRYRIWTGAIEKMSHFAVQQNEKKVPAKGAMAIPAACLYWCRWQFWGCGEPRPALKTQEETCVS